MPKRDNLLAVPKDVKEGAFFCQTTPASVGAGGVDDVEYIWSQIPKKDYGVSLYQVHRELLAAWNQITCQSAREILSVYLGFGWGKHSAVYRSEIVPFRAVPSRVIRSKEDGAGNFIL